MFSIKCLVPARPPRQYSVTGLQTQFNELPACLFCELLLCKQEGWTALMAATNNGRYGTVDILLQKGANPDRQDHVSLFGQD